MEYGKRQGLLGRRFRRFGGEKGRGFGRSEELEGLGRTVRAVIRDADAFTRRKISGLGRGRVIVELKVRVGDSGREMVRVGNFCGMAGWGQWSCESVGRLGICELAGGGQRWGREIEGCGGENMRDGEWLRITQEDDPDGTSGGVSRKDRVWKTEKVEGKVGRRVRGGCRRRGWRCYHPAAAAGRQHAGN